MLINIELQFIWDGGSIFLENSNFLPGLYIQLDICSHLNWELSSANNPIWNSLLQRFDLRTFKYYSGHCNHYATCHSYMLAQTLLYLVSKGNFSCCHSLKRYSLFRHQNFTLLSFITIPIVFTYLLSFSLVNKLSWPLDLPLITIIPLWN